MKLKIEHLANFWRCTDLSIPENDHPYGGGRYGWGRSAPEAIGDMLCRKEDVQVCY